MNTVPRPCLRTLLRPLFVLALACSTPLFASFVHPGGLHTQADLDRMKAHVAAGDHPWIDSWNGLLTDPKAQLTYNPAPQANMGASRQRAAADAVAAYLNAVRGYVSGDTAYTDNAIRICNLWSAAVNQVPSGTDQPGLNGIYTYQFAVVGELLRIQVGTRWAEADFERFKTMLSTYLYPACTDFLHRHNNACISHYWANWDAANIAAIGAIGVFCDDQAKWDEAVDYYKNGAGNGCIMNAVYFVHPGGPDEPYGLGQWQETGRDQEHNALGLGMLATFCEIAWHQGVDLYGYANNRLLAGAEYVAGYNLWKDMPYVPYNNCDNVNQYWPSTAERGRLQRPIWEMIYNHYVVRRGFSAPNLTAMAAVNRPEAFTHDDHFGYGTLAFTLDAAASPFPSAAPAVPTGLASEAGVGRVHLTWDPVPTANGFIVERAATSGGPYTTVASFRGTTAKYDDTSVTNGTTYTYRVSASNQIGTSGASAETSSTPQAAGPLPANWVQRQVGSGSVAGTAGYAPVSGGTFLVTGSGSGIGSTGDGHSFTFVAVSGDTTVTARLIGGNFGGVGPNARMGVMIRESLDGASKALVLACGDAGFRETKFGTRSVAGGPMSFVSGHGYSGPSWPPNYVRLQRTGDTFTASQSSDGITWFTVGSSTVPMNAVCYAGIAIGSGSANAISGDYDHVSVAGEILPGPPASLQAVNGDGRVSLAWTPVAGATGYDVRRSSASGGPYDLIASGLTGTSFVDSAVTQWTHYYYVVSTRQGTYESVASGEVLGTPGDLRTVWSPSAGSGLWSEPSNWTGGAAPTSGVGLNFGASAVATLNNDLTSLTVRGLIFDAGAPAYSISGNSLALSSDVVNNAPGTQTLSLPLSFNAPVELNAQSGPLVLSGEISDGSGAQALTKTGNQKLTLTGANTFSGDLTVAEGTLAIAGAGTGTAGAPTAGPLGRGTVHLAGGTLTSSAAARIYNSVVAEAGTTSAISTATANLTFAGNLSGGGTLVESGANVGGTHFNGDNSGFTGTFSSSNGGGHRVRFNAATAGSAAATWVLNNSQTDGYGLNFGTGTIAFGALSGGGVFRNDGPNGSVATLSIGALNTDTTFSGVMVANGTRYIAVTKVGSGQLTFTGAHTYDGPTTVAGGTLLVDRSIRSPVTVQAGTFGGTGSSTAPLTVGPGAALSPGHGGVGAFTTSAALTLQGGAVFRVELNSQTAASDRITASSVALAGATLEATDLGAAALPAGASFTLIDNTGADPISGTFSGLPEGALLRLGQNQFRLSYTGGTGNDAVLTAVVSASVSLDGLHQVFDGSPRLPTVSTEPADLAVALTYNGEPTAPVNAGTYDVVATITTPDYLGGATGTLVVDKAGATITLGGLSQVYDGAAKSATATTSPAGLPVSFTYDGSASAPVNAGSYEVEATLTHPNYTGAATGRLTIEKASATIVLGNLAQAYDGTPRPVTATTEPAGLPVRLSYDGTMAAPIYPGEHEVDAAVDDPNFAGTARGTLTIRITALVRHAPALNGELDGSLQLLAPESFSLNSGSLVSGDLLVPGTPALQRNGQPLLAGLKDGPGAASPSSYVVTLNQGSVLRYLVRRIDPLPMVPVQPPPVPTGTRDVSVNAADQSIGDFATLRNLTINARSGTFAVPAGTYGRFTLNGASTLVLGATGAAEPSVYNLQGLTVNAQAVLRIDGPVMLTVGSAVTVNGSAGSADAPDWLTLRVASGDLTVNSQGSLHALVLAPSSSVTINGKASGRVVSDRLTLNGSASWVDPASK